LVLSELHANPSGSIDVFTIPFRNSVACLVHHEDTVSSDEETIGMAGNEKEATKSTYGQAN